MASAEPWAGVLSLQLRTHSDICPQQTVSDAGDGVDEDADGDDDDDDHGGIGDVGGHAGVGGNGGVGGRAGCGGRGGRRDDEPTAGDDDGY